MAYIHNVSTRQKDILNVIHKCEDEMTGKQLHLAIVKGTAIIGLATVYRNLRVPQ